MYSFESLEDLRKMEMWFLKRPTKTMTEINAERQARLNQDNDAVEVSFDKDFEIQIKTIENVKSREKMATK